MERSGAFNGPLDHHELEQEVDDLFERIDPDLFAVYSLFRALERERDGEA